MLLRFVAHRSRILINQQTVRVYLSILHDKTPAVRNVHVLCSNRPSPDHTRSRGLEASFTTF